MRVKSRAGGGVGFNMTPMIDIVFNLIIFFMLVSQFYRIRVEDVKLPPASKASTKKQELQKYTQLVVNIVPPTDSRDKATRVIIDGQTILVFIVGENPPLMDPLIDLLKARNKTVGDQKHKPLNVICRAGESVTYDIVGSVMIATTKADIRNWWVMAYRPQAKGDREVKEFLGVANGSGGG